MRPVEGDVRCERKISAQSNSQSAGQCGLSLRRPAMAPFLQGITFEDVPAEFRPMVEPRPTLSVQVQPVEEP
ncbi:hypothetical protein KIN_35900 [Litoreibacter roseus]|uniref:Uncharacterized protein n=1 Tax=Litoreibacter roseus TaxID=2601869 RepID=A0A6N6JJP7_9RHOB|nr:hypothetical protein KIN_35900 [Litoreibacter roseus]